MEMMGPEIDASVWTAKARLVRCDMAPWCSMVSPPPWLPVCSMHGAWRDLKDERIMMMDEK